MRRGNSYMTYCCVCVCVCSFSDVVCGQIQCTDDSRTKPVVDYGYSYKVVSLASGKKCRYDQSMSSV